MADDENGWKRYGERVLTDMEDLKTCYKELSEKVITNKVNIAVLQVKAGVWGAVAGGIVALIPLIFMLLKNK